MNDQLWEAIKHYIDMRIKQEADADYFVRVTEADADVRRIIVELEQLKPDV